MNMVFLEILYKIIHQFFFEKLACELSYKTNLTKKQFDLILFMQNQEQ